ncbi:MAG: ElyC/SanA/YdcF family protein [Myxococcota bacterium]
MGETKHKVDGSTFRTLAHRFRGVALLTGSFLAGGVLTAWWMNSWIRRGAAPYLYEVLEEVPARRVAIVPGARVYEDGSPSTVLEDRLQGALALYRQGTVSRILVSGDHRDDGYDEVNAMHRWLRARGVPEEAVFMDHAGLRTLDTMVRAHRVFLVEDAVICTNEFHLDRSVFLARQAGIDAVGYVVDRQVYATHRKNALREFVARSGAFADTYFLDRQPRYLGDPIPIDADARQTHDHRTQRR